MPINNLLTHEGGASTYLLLTYFSLEIIIFDVQTLNMQNNIIIDINVLSSKSSQSQKCFIVIHEKVYIDQTTRLKPIRAYWSHPFDDNIEWKWPRFDPSGY